MNGHILALGTAVPPRVLTQTEALSKMQEFFPEGNYESLYENSGIKKRHVATDDYHKEAKERAFLGEKYPQIVPGMTKRNQFYKKIAPELARQASQKALDEWGGKPSDITHVISISCTGVVVPGIEFDLIHSLQLNPSIQRLGINFMGCFGAFKGLEVAHSFAKNDPKHRILIVCTELCSLHIQPNDTPDSTLANSLFADGAAAAIIGSEVLSNEKSLFELIKHVSFALDNSKEFMSWEASDTGYVMKLSSHVPVVLGRCIQAFTENLVQSEPISDYNFAIHPGGRAIVHAIEKKLNLTKDQTAAAWETLANYGNMSSATFLFVLEALKNQKIKKSKTVGLGFGPGLTVEGILMHSS